MTSSIRHKSLEFWEWLFDSFGTPASRYTLEAWVGTERFIFTAEPENIKAILATQFDDYGKGKPFHEDWKDFLGDSIFTTDGEQWHDSRALIRPQFIKDRVSDLVTFEKHVNVLLGLMGGNGQEVDVSALFFRHVRASPLTSHVLQNVSVNDGLTRPTWLDTRWTQPPTSS